MRDISILLVLAALLATTAVRADDEPAPDVSDTAELAREFTDPLTTLPQLFLQDALTTENYGTEAPGNRVVARLIVPRVPHFSLLPLVQLVRPSLTLVTVPTGKGEGTRTELGDMQLFDLFVLPWPKHESGLRVGVGPTFVFPTATFPTAGQGAWQVGPALGAVYKGTPRLLLGLLVQNPISFAYNDADRAAQNTLLLQPAVLVQVYRGWYVKSADSTWSFGWRDGSPTLIPLSFGVGRVIVKEGWPPINLFASGEWLVHRENAPVAPKTTARLGLTIAFPNWRPWR